MKTGSLQQVFLKRYLRTNCLYTRLPATQRGVRRERSTSDMRKKKQELNQFKRAGRLQHNQGRNLPVRLTSPRVIIGALVLLLMAIPGLSSLVIVKNVYAQSECLVVLCPTPSGAGLGTQLQDANSGCILLLCPTPTPSPTPFPTPTPNQTPRPVPTTSQTPEAVPTTGQTSGSVPTPNPTSFLTPTVTTSASPTATSAGRVQTPVPSQVGIPTTKRKNTGSQLPNLFGGNGFSQIMVVVAAIFLCLLLGLGVGLFFLRPMLLPSIHVKTPSNETTSWSLRGVPQTFARRTPEKKKRW